MQERIAQKYRKTPAEVLSMIRGIEDKAIAIGLDLRYETVQNTHTFDAHRLTYFAVAN